MIRADEGQRTTYETGNENDPAVSAIRRHRNVIVFLRLVGFFGFLLRFQFHLVDVNWRNNLIGVL